MVRDNASWPRYTERHHLEVFGRDVGKDKAGVCPEARSTVVGRLTKYYAARSTALAKNAESLALELRTYSMTLVLWQYRNRTETEPPRCAVRE